MHTPRRLHAIKIFTCSFSVRAFPLASESVLPSIFSTSVWLLGDASFHFYNFGPSFIFVCVLIVLYVLFKRAFCLNALSTTEDLVVSKTKMSNRCTPQFSNELPGLITKFGCPIIICSH